MSAALQFVHHGSFSLLGKTILWKEKEGGGDIIFKEETESQFHRFGDFKKQWEAAEGGAASARHRDVGLEIVKKILAHYRPHAIPDDNGYYAASAGVYKDGRLFVAVNNEHVIKHPFTGRGCAETTMLRKCMDATSDKDAQLNPVYLLSAKAKKLADGRLREDNGGSWSCPCGECRQNLRKHTVGADFIMLPTHVGPQSLEWVNAPTPSGLKPHQAWRIPHAQLYPTQEFRSLDPELSRLVWDGYDAITDSNALIPNLATAWPADVSQLTQVQYEQLRNTIEHPDMTLSGLNSNPTLANINRTLLHLTRQAYQKHARAEGVPNIEITTVLIKTTEGEFYPSVVVSGDLWLPSKPPEIATALSNAYNQKGVAEVYMMTFDNYQMQNERTNSAEGEGVSHQLKMPDPAGLGRLIKNMKSGDNPPLRVLPVNDGTLNEEKLRKISEPVLDIHQAFGPGYIHPKQSVAAGRG